MLQHVLKLYYIILYYSIVYDIVVLDFLDDSILSSGLRVDFRLITLGGGFMF